MNKPAGLLSQGDRSGEPSLVDVASHYLKTRYAKPGNVYVGLLHRLDRPASGVMLLAKTSKAAARLSEQFRAGTIAKLYWAIVAGSPAEDAGTWTDVLTKDSRLNRTHACIAEARSRRQGSLGRHSGSSSDGTPRSKLELSPRSGRSHQLRVQLASRGLPILGDIKYGAKRPVESARRTVADRPSRPADHLHAPDSPGSDHDCRAGAGRLARVLPGWPEPGCGSSRPAAGPRT